MSGDTIAFVPCRYGTQVVGGAETLTRLLVEELNERGWPVEVLTTCALDPYSWTNHFPPGEEKVHGIRVRRFPTESRKYTRRVFRTEQRILAGKKVSRRKQDFWIRNVVTSRAMADYIEENLDRYRAFVFAPYLFGTTYLGVRGAPGKSYIIPCLHDEPYAYLHVYKRMMRMARGLMFNSVPEMELARHLYGDDLPGRVVGMGFGDYPADGNRFRDKYSISGDFVLYCGRREIAKNTPMLLRYFCNYLENTGREVSLVLTGAGHIDIPFSFRNRVIDVGFVDERDLRDAYSAAAFICHPSVNESFSIMILEAWLARLPCLIHADCAVTRYHVEHSDGGLWFRDYPTFHEAVDFILDHPEVRWVMGEKGREYVLGKYSWDEVVRNFSAVLEDGEGERE
ncbi:MAG: glycosyltransferase family 4 protein [Actinomycetota bacterium]|nr:glycosyltransferase family 4 protein [Actinomycetota bacterium]